MKLSWNRHSNAADLGASGYLKNGSVCCLSSNDLHRQPMAILEWLLTPKILSALS